MSREYTANTTPVLRQMNQNATPSTTIRRQCRQVETIAHKMRDENGKLKALNDVLSDQVTDLKKEIERKNREIAKQKEAINALNRENLTMVAVSAYETLKQENERMEQELQSLRAHVKTLERTKKQYESEVDAFRDEMTKLTDELEIRNKRTAELDLIRDERDALVVQCHKFQDKLVATEDLRRQEIETLQSAYEEKIQAMQEQIDELTENSFSMSGEHIIMPPAVVESAPESLNVAHEMMYNELVEEVNFMKQQHEEQLKELQDLIEQKDRSLDELNKQTASMQDELSFAKSRIDALNVQYEEAVKKFAAECEVKDEEKSLLVSTHAAAVSQMQETIANRESIISTLQTEVQEIASHGNEALKTLTAKMDEAFRAHELACQENESKLQTLLSRHEQEVADLVKAVENKDIEISSLGKELNVLSVDLESKITASDVMIGDLCQQVTKQIIECKSSHQTELRRLVAESKSRQSEVVAKKESELQDLWNLLIEKDATIQKLEDRARDQDVRLESALSDQKSCALKFEQMSHSRSEQVNRLEDEMRDQRRMCQEVHGAEIQRLNADLKRCNEKFQRKEAEIQQLRDELQLMEESFAGERLHKERYRKESQELEKKLDSMRSTSTGNNTYIMPTINFGSGTETQNASAAAAIVNSLSQNHAANSTRRPLPGTSFFVADEPSEVMNSSFISTAEDPFERFSTLQERNRRQPPHLKSSYAAEHQEIAIPENQIKGIPERQILAAMANGGANQTFSITDTTTHTRTFRYVSQSACPHC